MRIATGALALVALASAGTAGAQQITAEEALANAQTVYSADSVARRCRPSAGEEIVVCADRGGDQRVPSTAQSDPNSREALRLRNGGIPPAPRVTNLPDCTVERCIGFGRVPPPVYIIDVTALPQAPEGSDADLIAKGEKRAP